jgi:hypothetical protein
MQRNAENRFRSDAQLVAAPRLGMNQLPTSNSPTPKGSVAKLPSEIRHDVSGRPHFTRLLRPFGLGLELGIGSWELTLLTYIALVSNPQTRHPDSSTASARQAPQKRSHGGRSHGRARSRAGAANCRSTASSRTSGMSADEPIARRSSRTPRTRGASRA